MHCRALQRLRHTLDDELLVRTKDGYQLTPRAERIQRELATVLPRLEILFGGEHFDHLVYEFLGSCLADEDPALDNPTALAARTPINGGYRA